MIKAWLFDLDGTLADTAPDLASALNYVLTANGRDEVSPRDVRPYAGFGSSRLIELGFGLSHPDEKNLKAALLDYYANNVAAATRLFAGMEEILNRLDRNNIKWGVVTNKPARFTLPLLASLNILSRAQVVVSGDSTTKAKPHPQPILHALEQLKLKPAEALYIGDSEIDLKACQAAGINMICAAYGYLRECDNPDDWTVRGIVDSPQGLGKYID